jgi:hypothetical protein
MSKTSPADLLASAVAIITSGNPPVFIVKPWRTLMTKATAKAQSKAMKAAMKKIGPAPKHESTTDKGQTVEAEADGRGVDTSTDPVVQSGFSVFNQPVGVQVMNAEVKKIDPAAAQAEKEAKVKAAIAAKEAEKVAKAEAAAAREEKAKAAAAEKATKTAEMVAKREAEALTKAQAAADREARKAETQAQREARIAALKESGKNYVGSMLALAERAKSGAYVKSATGQMRSTDELAVALDAVPAKNVVALGTLMFSEANKYERLNIGQQSMNYRNRMRGAIAKGVFTLRAVIDARDTNGYATATIESDAKVAAREAKAKAKAEKEAQVIAAKAAKEAEKQAKAAAKAAMAKAAEKATA